MNQYNLIILSIVQNAAEIFPASTGGAQAMSRELNVEFLGSIPLDPLLARCCDEGKNFVTEMPDSPTVTFINDICKRKVPLKNSIRNNAMRISPSSDRYIYYFQLFKPRTGTCFTIR